MNKLFDVIPVEDYAVVVDRGAKIVEGWKGWAYKQDVKGQLFKHFYTTNTWYDDALIVIATLYKRIDNIPLVEINDNAEMKRLAHEVEVDENFQPKSGAFYYGFIKGYTAAQGKGMYSEEDMLIMFEAGRSYGFMECAEGYGVMYDFENKPVNGETYLKHFKINKLPKQVELDCNYEDKGQGGLEMHKYFPVTTHPDTNTIIPLNVIYE